MAYSTNPNLPKARAIAMQLLIRDGLPVKTVIYRCDVSSSSYALQDGHRVARATCTDSFLINFCFYNLNRH